MPGPADRGEAVAAAAEARSYLADGHYTGAHLGENTEVTEAHAGLDANETLPLLADLVVAEVCFGHKAALGVDSKVLVDVVAGAYADAVQGLAKALKVDASVEHADFALVLVGTGLQLRARDTGNRQDQDHPNVKVSPCHEKPLHQPMRDSHRKTGTHAMRASKMRYYGQVAFRSTVRRLGIIFGTHRGRVGDATEEASYSRWLCPLVRGSRRLA